MTPWRAPLRFPCGRPSVLAVAGGSAGAAALLHWPGVAACWPVTHDQVMRRRARPPAPLSEFAGFRFPPEVIVLAVRWYLRYALSYRDVEELLADRCIVVDHVTLFRWVRRFTPLLIDAARPCRHSPGGRWFIDETHVKIAGRWCYLYRAIDQFGQVIDRACPGHLTRRPGNQPAAAMSRAGSTQQRPSTRARSTRPLQAASPSPKIDCTCCPARPV